jgi:hypothetical protein
VTAFTLLFLAISATSQAQDPEEGESSTQELVVEEVIEETIIEEVVVEEITQEQVTIELELAPAEEIAEQQVKVVDFKNDLLGFEYFLIDQEQFELIQLSCECELAWEQPDISVYKAEPKSRLTPDIIQKAGEGYAYPHPLPPPVLKKEE